MFKNSSTFRPPDVDMQQNYPPTGSTAATCPAADSSNWTCQFTSDQFTAGQTLNAGTATADLYLENAGPLPVYRSAAQNASSATTSIAITKPASLQDGDVLIAYVAVHGDVSTAALFPAPTGAVATNTQCNTIIFDPSSPTADTAITSSGSNRISETSMHATKTTTAGATAAITNGNCPAAPGVAYQLTLKQGTNARTCNLTVSLNVVRPITFVEKSTATMNPGPSLQISTPAGTVQNDLMIASMAYTQGATVTQPGGWSSTSTFCQGTTFCLTSYYLIAPASPAPSYTWTIGTSSTVAVGTMSSYRNVNPSNPVDTYYSSAPPNGTAQATGASGNSFSNELVYAVFAVAPTSSTATFTEPTGMTDRVDTAISASPAFYSMETTDIIQPLQGAVPVYTATSSVAAVGETKGILLIPAAPSSLGSATASITSPSGPTLVSTPITTSGWTFLTGDRLAVDVVAPNDSANCGVRLSYDSTSTQSKITVATVVPEGVAGLLVLAPALPLGARWWKRRRP